MKIEYQKPWFLKPKLTEEQTNILTIIFDMLFESTLFINDNKNEIVSIINKRKYLINTLN